MTYSLTSSLKSKFFQRAMYLPTIHKLNICHVFSQSDIFILLLLSNNICHFTHLHGPEYLSAVSFKSIIVYKFKKQVNESRHFFLLSCKGKKKMEESETEELKELSCCVKTLKKNITMWATLGLIPLFS